MRRTSTALLSVLGVLLVARIAQAQEIMFVANPAASVSQISRDQLRDIFIGARTRFGDGSRAVPVLLKGGPVHEVFLSRIVGDSPDGFRVRWRRVGFTGQGAMPKEFQSEAAVLDYVSATPGAIGYVSRVPDPHAVKVLTVLTDSAKK
jgi:ABC-type phosphate transport system substrate-binding protein